ncbi:MAG: hypothetical protein AB1805_05100 [Nitrospirota bacterium]
MSCYHHLRTITILFGLLAAAVLASACGKKGDPTLKTFEQPLPVAALSVSHTEEGLVVSWPYPQANRESIKGFYIEKAEGDRCEGFANAAFLKGDADRFVDRDFSPGRVYCYRIRVYSLRDIISDSSPVFKAAPVALPAPPERVFFTVKKNAIEIGWEGSGEVSGFTLYKSAAKEAAPLPSPLNKALLKERSFVDAIDTARPVYYRVRSVVESGIVNEGPASQPLEVDPASFVPSRPAGLRFVAMPKAVHLQWNENPESWVRGYRVFRRAGQEKEFVAIGDVVAPAFADPDPAAGKAFYAVAALGPAQESPLSEPVAVSPYIER